MELIDGKLLSKQIKEEIARDVAEMKKNGQKTPHLAAVLIGADPASQSYVKSKTRSCDQVGFKSSLIERDENVTEEEVLQIVHDLNNDPDVDGFIVQLPLPKHIDELKITLAIDPKKDVDGFHPVNVGRMSLGLPSYIPATPYGILQMLERYKIETSGLHCVVVGRSNIVGTPMSILMSRKAKIGNATVTIAHSRTRNLKKIVQQADIVIAAIGIANFVTVDMIKPGAIVIDVGINRIADASKKRGYRVVGDVDFENVAPISSFITPVPGGVGLMTVTSLMMNTLQAAKKEIYG